MSDFERRKGWAMVKAILTLAWFRFRHSLGWPGRLYGRFRKPTRGRQVKGGWMMYVLGPMFLVQGFWMTGMMIERFADRAMVMEEGVIALDEFSHLQIAGSVSEWEEMTDVEMAADLEFILSFSKSRRVKDGLSPLTSEEFIAQFREKGAGGFRSQESFSRGRLMTLGDLDGEKRAYFSRLLGMVFLGLLVALLFMPMAVRQKNLAATSDHQEWLFSLPLKESELLAGTFVASVLIRPLAYIVLWPLLTNVLIANGVFFLWAGLLGLGLMFLISVAISGVEILLDTWMRSRAPAVVVKNGQMVFSVLGLLAFYAVLAACVAGEASLPWLAWLAERLPGEVGLPVGEILVSPIWMMLGCGVLVAVILGGGGIALAGRLMRSGWLSGNGQHAKKRGIGGARLKGGSLLKFEGLLLLRDRTLATQVILVPILIVGYQVLINPSMVFSVTVAGICAMAYACGTYASLITAPQVLMSEAKGVWLIYNLPMPVAAYFGRRETLWRSVATGLAAILVVVMLLTSGAFRVEDLWRYVAALLGVWVMGKVVSGIVMGRPKMPDVAAGERPKIGAGRMYGAMLMAGSFGGLLWQGMIWPLVSSLVIFWFLGVAIWQRRNVSFSYLMEPVEEEPPSWGVDDGLWAVVVFFVVQVLVSVIGVLLGEMTSGLVLASFVAGGLAAMAFVWIRRNGKGIPLPEIPDDGEKKGWQAMAVETGVATLLCLAVGIAWTKILETGVFGDAGTGVFEWSPVVLILLAVVAAPILEELLFRGFMCRTMLGFWSKRNAVLGSALIFAVVHPGPSFPPVFLLGLAAAILYLRSRSVVPGMILHALYNLGIVWFALWG
jgi:ABC-2 type transport system permease protein